MGHGLCLNLTLTSRRADGFQGYDLGVDDDLQAVGVEDAADVHLELVELVDGLRRAHVPQHAVVQHQVVGGVEGGAVPLVVVGQVLVVQGQSLLARLDVVDLAGEAGFSITGQRSSTCRDSWRSQYVPVPCAPWCR